MGILGPDCGECVHGRLVSGLSGSGREPQPTNPVCVNGKFVVIWVRCMGWWASCVCESYKESHVTQMKLWNKIK